MSRAACGRWTGAGVEAVAARPRSTSGTEGEVLRLRTSGDVVGAGAPIAASAALVGGVLGTTEGLRREFGHRVLDTPVLGAAGGWGRHPAPGARCTEHGRW
ncbi:hypothetical protein MO973_37730 [Paenibacillus sp. TRM 82003]|nr:hypothetical protein [Paenibacillus sp. TRM 82003]